MIQVCRVCEIRTGGLIRSHYEAPTSDWPEPDLCPECAKQYIPNGYYLVEDADGEHLVKLPT